MTQSNFVRHTLKPIVDSNSKVLILGSFPSVVSRKQEFYYANKTNRFWKVMEEIFHCKIEDREIFLHEKGIALWDVIASCTISASSDASIENVTVNDIESLIQNTQIHTIFTTGSKASKLYEKYFHLDIEHISLPSTSSANARMKLETLVREYQVIKERCDETES